MKKYYKYTHRLTEYERVHAEMRRTLPPTHICDHPKREVAEDIYYDGFFFDNEFASKMSNKEFQIIVDKYAAYRRMHPLTIRKF